MSALAEIERKVKEAKRAVEQIGYSAEPVSAKEFYDYMTGEIFSDDVTTLHDVLDNEFLMIHELVEISELKKRGRAIDKRVIVESPKTVIYEAYFAALNGSPSMRYPRTIVRGWKRGWKLIGVVF
jgi:hypothetical protein